MQSLNANELIKKKIKNEVRESVLGRSCHVLAAKFTRVRGACPAFRRLKGLRVIEWFDWESLWKGKV